MKKTIVLIFLIAVIMLVSLSGAVDVNWEPYQKEIAPVEIEIEPTLIIEAEADDDMIYFSSSDLVLNWDAAWHNSLILDFDNLDMSIYIDGKEYKVKPIIREFLWWKHLILKLEEVSK